VLRTLCRVRDHPKRPAGRAHPTGWLAAQSVGALAITAATIGSALLGDLGEWARATLVLAFVLLALTGYAIPVAKARVAEKRAATVEAESRVSEQRDQSDGDQTSGHRVPAEPGELDDWIAGGRVVQATVSGPIPMPTQPSTGEEAGRLLRELRDEERW
jgi:hypothetical protein